MSDAPTPELAPKAVGPMHPATITVLLHPSAIFLPVSAETPKSTVTYFSAPFSAVKN